MCAVCGLCVVLCGVCGLWTKSSLGKETGRFMMKNTSKKNKKRRKREKEREIDRERERKKWKNDFLDDC